MMRKSYAKYSPYWVFSLLFGVVVPVLIGGCATTTEKTAIDKKLIQNFPSTQAPSPSLVTEETTAEHAPPRSTRIPELKTSLVDNPVQGSAQTSESYLDWATILGSDGLSEPIKINVENLPLNEFIQFALGKILKVSYSLEETIGNRKDKITLRMPVSVEREKALQVVLKVLRDHNIWIDAQDQTLYISEATPARQGAHHIEIGRQVRQTTGTLTQVVPLRYIASRQMHNLIKEFYKGIGPFKTTFFNTTTLVISGPVEIVQAVVKFIVALDIPLVEKRDSTVIQLSFLQAEEFVSQMTLILRASGFRVATMADEQGVLLLPLFGTKVLIFVYDQDTMNFIQDWVKQVDVAAAAGTEEIVRTYSPAFSKASDLVEAINKLYGGQPKVAASVFSPSQGVKPTQASRAKGQPRGRQRPSSSGPGDTVSSEKSLKMVPQGFKISADDLRNLVLIAAPPATFGMLRDLLKKLDKPMRQVLIEVTLAELTLDDQLQFGLEWALKSGSFDLQTLGNLGLGSLGLNIQFLSDTGNFQALLNAFAKDDKIKILSSPRLLVLDNQEASIQIGTEVPVVTSEVSASDVTTALPTVNRNIQMRQTGVLLRIRPTIHTEGLLTLDISQELSEAQTNSSSTIDSPEIFSRRIDTSAVVENGETLILGGLISETKEKTINKIPVLGDIPLLGYLFKTTSERTRRTELLVMITPHILSNKTQAREITDQIIESLEWLDFLDPIPTPRPKEPGK